MAHRESADHDVGRMAVILTLLIFATLLYLWAQGRRQTHKVHAYFLHAVKVYALAGEQDARMAALAAGWRASPRQRTLMLDFLSKRSSEVLLETAEDNAGRNPLLILDRLLQLKQEVAGQVTPTEASRDAAPPELEWLRDYNPAYLQALEHDDPQIFIARHPDLFVSKPAAAATAKKDEPV